MITIAGRDFPALTPEPDDTRPRADLFQADLRRADLRGVDLRDGFLAYADFTNADLACANLQDAYMVSAVLRGASLTNANLRRADLTGATLTDADLTGADLTGADLTEADLRRASLVGATLTGATLPTGETFEEYLEEVVPELLAAAGRLEDALSPAVWECHDWTNCPMAAAFRARMVRAAPRLLQPRIWQFIQLYDAGQLSRLAVLTVCRKKGLIA